MFSMNEQPGLVVGGVDTHKDTHHAAVVDTAGRVLGEQGFTATALGYAALWEWLSGFGRPVAVGIEGTGSYGAGLTRWLRATAAGVRLVEVDRPDRKTRRNQGKSDPIDAIVAARQVVAGIATGTPKTRTGAIEAIRLINTTRRSAIKARTAAINELKAEVVTAPEKLRQQLSGLKNKALIGKCAKLRGTGPTSDPGCAIKIVLARLAHRIGDLTTEIEAADTDLNRLVTATAPITLAQFGVGSITAAQLLATAGDNPARLGSEACFAHLCGVAPIPASSGRTDRHRLNRGGDRQANSALYRIVLSRMAHHQPTKDYVARRTTEGKTIKDIIRCLKRYVARKIYRTIICDLNNQTDPQTPTTAAA